MIATDNLTRPRFLVQIASVRAEFDALIKRAATDDPFAPLLRERSPFLQAPHKVF